MNEKDGSILRCPHCRIVAFPSKEMGMAKTEEFERFVDATFEVLGEVDDDDDLSSFSGER